MWETDLWEGGRTGKSKRGEKSLGVKVGGWVTHLHEIVKEKIWLIKNKCLNIIPE